MYSGARNTFFLKKKKKYVWKFSVVGNVFEGKDRNKSDKKSIVWV